MLMLKFSRTKYLLVFGINETNAPTTGSALWMMMQRIHICKKIAIISLLKPASLLVGEEEDDVRRRLWNEERMLLERQVSG